MKKKHLLGDALILTVSDQIEELDYLLENLSNICFHIAAPVQFSDKIRRLETKHNVRLLTVTNEQERNFLVNMCDILLDINHFQEVDLLFPSLFRLGNLSLLLTIQSTEIKVKRSFRQVIQINWFLE